VRFRVSVVNSFAAVDASVKSQPRLLFVIARNARTIDPASARVVWIASLRAQ
jgi:hypothetical protein